MTAQLPTSRPNPAAHVSQDGPERRSELSPETSDRFQIHKSDHWRGFWYLDYPRGFRKEGGPIGEVCSSFAVAVAAFVERLEQQCPTCLRGAVVDTDWGWKCEACGSYDVAVGCEAP